MDYELDRGAQLRLGGYFDEIGDVLANKKRRESFAQYAMGLFSESERKSMEPLAARLCGEVGQADAHHQRLQHFITDSDWSDRGVRRVAASFGLRALTQREAVQSWIIDDTGFLKQGNHSVGVQRQYTGSAGKIANCQIGVSLSVATATEHLPIDFELYLPKSWTEDASKRREGRIPDELSFKTKPELALEMIERAVMQNVPCGVVLADAFYGDEPSFRRGVRALGLHYAVGVKSDNRVWHLDKRDRCRGEPMTVAELVRTLSPRAFRRITWREGTNSSLSSRFALMRVKPAYRNEDEPTSEREALWLVIEWPPNEDKPTAYSLASLGAWSRKMIVRMLKQRWRTERVYEDLKGELGLDHFEGRKFQGWHHHVSVALCCYAFIVAERVRHFPPSTRWATGHDSFAFPNATTLPGLIHHSTPGNLQSFDRMVASVSALSSPPAFHAAEAMI